MGKKDRYTPRSAFVTLRDLPGTRVMFWLVGDCPYCGGQHLHRAGNLRSADPADTLGEQSAPCDPQRRYVLTLPPRLPKKRGREARRKERRAGRLQDTDE